MLYSNLMDVPVWVLSVLALGVVVCFHALVNYLQTDFTNCPKCCLAFWFCFCLNVEVNCTNFSEACLRSETCSSTL